MTDDTQRRIQQIGRDALSGKITRREADRRIKNLKKGSSSRSSTSSETTGGIRRLLSFWKN